MFLHPIDTVDPELLAKVLGRDRSLFSNDWENNICDIQRIVSGKRIVVIGAAGSIGRAFTKLLAHFELEMLHLIDPSENNLVEVIRDMRSTGLPLPEDFKTFSIELGSEEFDDYVKCLGSCDYLINFSALKHVRAERDPFTLSRLFRTNIYGTHKLVEAGKLLKCSRIFSVSSDKSVNPANLMGATKAMMEQILFASSEEVSCSSARFANVAFSDGSLLAGFFNRFDKKQPFAAPNDVRRYFISHLEAAQLCMLSCFLGNNREVFYPKMDASKDALTFSKIAELFLESRGYQPVHCLSESEAIGKVIIMKEGKWPCLFSGSDTSGEKDLEEFYFEEEKRDENRFENLGIVTEPVSYLNRPVEQLITLANELKESNQWSREKLIDLLIECGLTCLKSVDSDKNLDQKM
jgi:FlaA1/EpsC-like NDP-sugar epimerase